MTKPTEGEWRGNPDTGRVEEYRDGAWTEYGNPICKHEYRAAQWQENPVGIGYAKTVTKVFCIHCLTVINLSDSN